MGCGRPVGHFRASEYTYRITEVPLIATLAQNQGREMGLPVANGTIIAQKWRGVMTKKLEGKVAVITGGNSGIGLATGKRFAAEGAKVVITGRRQPELDAAVKEIGPDAMGVRGDVSSLADLDRLYATVKEKHGRVDIVFANAGAAEFAPLGQITEEHFDKAF